MSLDRAGGWLAEARTVTSGPRIRAPSGCSPCRTTWRIQQYGAGHGAPDASTRRGQRSLTPRTTRWCGSSRPAGSGRSSLKNIDGLNQSAGNSPGCAIEVHGSLHETQCLTCSDRQPMPDILRRVDSGDEDPACGGCGGILKSATISFGQSLVPKVLAAAVAAAQDCDLFLAIGSSLSVQPAAGLTGIAHRCGARVVIVNAQPTPYDDLADCVLRSPIGEAVPALVDPALAGAT